MLEKWSEVSEEKKQELWKDLHQRLRLLRATSWKVNRLRKMTPHKVRYMEIKMWGSMRGERMRRFHYSRGSCGDIDPNIRNLINDVYKRIVIVFPQSGRTWETSSPTVKWRIKGLQISVQRKSINKRTYGNEKGQKVAVMEFLTINLNL